MTQLNHDASQVGVPYARSARITINYPDKGQLPEVAIERMLAVRLADGSAARIGDVPPAYGTIDLAAVGSAPIPLIHPDTSEPIGGHTSLNEAFMVVLAVVRHIEQLHDAA